MTWISVVSLVSDSGGEPDTTSGSQQNNEPPNR